MQLNVFVNNKKIGLLKEIEPDPGSKNPIPRIQFEYLENVDINEQISLLMPVSQKQYIYHELPPVFDMILPEGQRRASILQMAKITRVDDMGLLSLVGHNTIGRVQICSGENIGSIPKINLDDLETCENGFQLFEELLIKSGFRSGISGVQPKALASKTSCEQQHRTLTTATHIIKSFDPDEFPWLTVNEYFCLKAAKKAGIDVPDFILSEDGTLLGVKRFDQTDNEAESHCYRYGFEEIVALLGGKSSTKYNGTIEEIINCIDDHIDITESLPALKSIFKQTVFNTLIRNGDAHLKNYGLLYGQGKVFLSPAYDLVCTQAYINNDIPALALEYENYTKRWWSKEELAAFGARHCYIKKKEVEQVYAEVVDAMTSTLDEIRQYIAGHEEFTEIGQKMIDIWQSSIHDLGLDQDEEESPGMKL
ncbi:type II toxin-antitoxin system HipA family toxin (plasmid) [Methylomarinum sp. Ch1-1]|uniref:Type II toxin-antitoxin system HipA family toxin n=1 Tax=Methylomarinum roseum TaxID=3067653 RepID=A0AAU7P0F9_9GAMM|nr:type II toxin-antitoxin system HipA family toxin [Methylomarinum sp. Ch1-1]MDP4523339.1 type II toxin-antitoxin system HipA family toxin [Methylomarinum sp. Ch1-1]